MAQSGPIQCTTTLEAPLLPVRGLPAGSLPPAPVQLTRCQPVETVPQLLERRAYTWTAPYAQGVGLLHQITDALGIAVGGESGNRVMGLGFPEQTLIWDDIAIHNTSAALMELQSDPMPRRTPDLRSVFNSSLASGDSVRQLRTTAPAAGMAQPGGAAGEQIRGLW